MKMTTAGKVVVLLLVAGAGFGIYKKWGSDIMNKIAPGKEQQASMVPKKITLPGEGDNGSAEPVNVNMPGLNPGAADKTQVRMLVWAWNSQMGLMFANGGPVATEGSIMARNGVNLNLERQDDAGKMQEALVAFATQLARGTKQPTAGAHFVNIMGDGSAAFLAGLNGTLKRLGTGYTAKIVMSCGYSRGEDKFMGPPEWKQNPEAAKGGVVAGYLRDGDWNIAQKWLGDNGLKTNPDEKTWDPDALNWVAANDYIDAAEKYISGYSEDRPVVRNGKRTGETKHITVQGVVTWTPGDVTVAQKKGGLVSIVSTKEYSRQMPNVVIGIDKWMRENRGTVEGMIEAIAEGGTAVKGNADALKKAGEVSQMVYKEQGADANYWVKYYKGTVEQDKTGLAVELGGSSVNDLAEAMYTFGLLPGSANLFAATYQVFGDVVVQQYPNLVPSYPPVEQILDTSYLQDVGRKNRPSPTAVAQVSRDIPVSKGNVTVSTKNIYIPFATGKADFSPSARGVLERLRRELLIASGTSIELHGHTDNVGSPDANMKLSEARAFAVQRWLEKAFPRNFPAGRVRVYAEGQTHPLVPNSSEGNRARNRRVEVVLTSR